MTAIDPALLKAYRASEYRVQAQPPFILRVGHASVPLASLHAQYGVVCSAYITACNPFGRQVDAALNVLHQRQLAAELNARGAVFFPGVGIDPSGSWLGEPSFLVLGLDEDQARTLGNQHEQNAVLCCDEKAVPRLVFLR
ncbi:MAG: DUF3293 domain-containing protein [Burkholderiaceae bacterium]|nr:MAG: DUF3293 domain-containing protein [Burkholderiaceae bacterium]